MGVESKVINPGQIRQFQISTATEDLLANVCRVIVCERPVDESIEYLFRYVHLISQQIFFNPQIESVLLWTSFLVPSSVFLVCPFFGVPNLP